MLIFNVKNKKTFQYFHLNPFPLLSPQPPPLPKSKKMFDDVIVGGGKGGCLGGG